MIVRITNLPRPAPEAPAGRDGAAAAELIRRLGAALRAGASGSPDMQGPIDPGALAPALTPEEAVDANAEAVAREAARALDNRRRRLRANAHAAFHSVQGSEEAAVDAALAVVEAAWLAARAEREAYAEVLKVIRLYARDCEIRALAAQVLREEIASPPGAIGPDAVRRPPSLEVLHG